MPNSQQGYIDFDGFLKLLFSEENLSTPKMVANSLFQEFDIDRDGSLSFDEFKAMFDNYRQETGLPKLNDLEKQFQEVDQNGDSTIQIEGILNHFIFSM